MEKITIASGFLNTPRFNLQRMNVRAFWRKHIYIKINKKIKHVVGNLDLSMSSDAIRKHELS